MTDYISREAAITAIQKAYIDTQEGFDKAAVKINVGLTKALHIMQDLPAADVVEVIRCKDCMVLQNCRFAQGLGLDGYCSQGERR